MQDMQMHSKRQTLPNRLLAEHESVSICSGWTIQTAKEVQLVGFRVILDCHLII